ncbi:MAG: hypothetical protein J7647_22210 [Cyanobacteria bacterium SBLK]|nr:hypothetical protein [Cyanobacteria bacterium SBLK]
MECYKELITKYNKLAEENTELQEKNQQLKSKYDEILDGYKFQGRKYQEAEENYRNALYELEQLKEELGKQQNDEKQPVKKHTRKPKQYRVLQSENPNWAFSKRYIHRIQKIL